MAETNVVPFRRDLAKAVAEATALRADMTVDDLLDRHRRLNAVFGEVWSKPDATPAEIEVMERASVGSDAFHALAARAGVPAATVAAFNEARRDWKAWAEWRKTLPPGCRI